jgi:hypothetical protein
MIEHKYVVPLRIQSLQRERERERERGGEREGGGEMIR